MTEKNKKYRLLQGNEACAEGALAAGVTFCAGYPITPSTEIIEVLARELPKRGGKFIQMEDEIASMAAVIGASLTGAKALTATSGPGFSLKQENIGYACIAEVPCVIVNVQRTGPSTGLPTQPAQGDVMQAKWGTHGDHPIIVLSPSSVGETYDLTIQCFNLAEKYMTPVILLLDEVVAHMRERVEVRDEKDAMIVNREIPQIAHEEYLPYKPDEKGVVHLIPFGRGYRYHVTGLVHDETGFPTRDPQTTQNLINRLMAKTELNKEEICMWEEEHTEDAEIVLVAYGSTARSAQAAMEMARNNGKKVGMVRYITIWPFNEKVVQRIAGKGKKIIVPEMNMGQLVYEVERAAQGKCEVIPLNVVNGEMISPDTILRKIGEVS